MGKKKLKTAYYKTTTQCPSGHCPGERGILTPFTMAHQKTLKLTV
jgi:hypothetical protein